MQLYKFDIQTALFIYEYIVKGVQLVFVYRLEASIQSASFLFSGRNMQEIKIFWFLIECMDILMHWHRQKTYIARGTQASLMAPILNWLHHVMWVYTNKSEIFEKPHNIFHVSLSLYINKQKLLFGPLFFQKKPVCIINQVG